MIKKYTLFIAILLANLFAESQVSFDSYYYNLPDYFLSNAGVGDFNGDGRPDVITLGYNTNNFTTFNFFVFTQNTDGTLDSTPVIIPFSHGSLFANYLAVARMGTDTLTDVIVSSGDSLYIYYQSAAHTLISPSSGIYAGSQIDGFAIADIDSDGYNDIAVSFTGDSALRVFYGSATHNSFTKINYPSQWQSGAVVSVGKVGHQTRPSIIKLCSENTYSGYIIETRVNPNRTLNATNYLQPFNQQGSFFTTDGAASGDRFGDGNYEIVSSLSENMPVAALIYYSHPDSSNQPDDTLRVIDIPENIIMTDLNCDGKAEIIVGHGAFNKISVVMPDNTVKTFAASIYNTMQSMDMVVGDVSGDGKPDIIVVNSNTLTVLKNTTPELLGNYVLVSDTMHTDTSTVYPYGTAYQPDTLFAQNDTVIIKTTTLSVSQVKHDSLFYVTSAGYGIGFCFGDTVSVTDTNTVIVNTTYTFDSTLASVTYDTIITTPVQNIEPLNNSVKIYPNPFTNGFSIEIFNQPTDVEVYNETGVLMLRFKCETGCFVKRNYWPPGLYTLKITRGEVVTHQKLVAQ